jgi:hypothetical protein
MSRPQKIIPPIRGEFQGIINAVADGKGMPPKPAGKHMAKLIGGPYDGQTREFENIPQSFEIVERATEGGKRKTVRTLVYRLKSEKPLEYEFTG